MPEHLRALVFILILSGAMLALAKAPACATAIDSRAYDGRRNLWFLLTLIVFLAHNYWLFIVASGVLLFLRQKGDKNPLALYFFVLLAIPPIPGEISGLGLINYFFQIEYVRLLALVVLLPAFISLRKQPGVEPIGRLLSDKFLLGYIGLDILLMFEHRTFTHILREGVFYGLLDIVLPYYVASRALRRIEEFRDALMSFAVAAIALSAVLFFEMSRGWLLYQSLESALGSFWAWNDYLVRGTSVRATGTIGHSIAAGYVVAVGIAYYLYLRKTFSNQMIWGLGFVVLLAGLISPLSRGPWVGVAFMFALFVVTGPAPAKNIAKIGLIALVALPIVMISPYGSKIIDYLPFIGSVDERNVVFRQNLAAASFRVFWENPVFGRSDFVDTPTMQALKGGDGLVDLVNTYVVVALGRGIVGLALFVGFFLVVLHGILKTMRKQIDKNDERYALGQALMAAILGMLLIIATVSPILRIPLLYWIGAGLGVSYVQMLGRMADRAVPTGQSSDANMAANAVVEKVYTQVSRWR